MNLFVDSCDESSDDEFLVDNAEDSGKIDTSGPPPSSCWNGRLVGLNWDCVKGTIAKERIICKMAKLVSFVNQVAGQCAVHVGEDVTFLPEIDLELIGSLRCQSLEFLLSKEARLEEVLERLTANKAKGGPVPG